MNDQSKFSRENWRAMYNPERNSFVVEQAGWVDDEPALEYIFCALESETGYMAALEKCWASEDGGFIGEPFVFAEYETPGEFEADVDYILAEATQHAQSEGVDHFLAVIDVVKVRAFDAGYVDDEVFDCPVLFHDGPEDAYTRWDEYGDDVLAEIVRFSDFDRRK